MPQARRLVQWVCGTKTARGGYPLRNACFTILLAGNFPKDEWDLSVISVLNVHGDGNNGGRILRGLMRNAELGHII